MRIINEPTAACLAYGLRKNEDKRVAVYHLGGGTFDISILELGEGVFEVKSTNGNTHLGGDDFDQRLINWMCNNFKEEQGVDLRQDKAALQRLKEAAEKAKCELSSAMRVDINLPYITNTSTGSYKNLLMTLTRARLEKLVGDLIEETFDSCRKAFADTYLTIKDINEVVLVGRQTRMPAVQKAVEKVFGRPPCRGVDPAEAVALGAAIEGGVLLGDIKNVLLLDVIPMSLGVEVSDGVFTKIIKCNSTIPTKHSQIFSTTLDNQTAVNIHVLQEEQEMAADCISCISLGRFELVGIPPVPKGTPQIEVTFDIDVNGIFHVSAQDKATGKKMAVRITPATSPEVIKLKDGQKQEEEKKLEEARQKEAEEKKREEVRKLEVARKKAEKEACQKEAEEVIQKAQQVLSRQDDPLAAYAKTVINSKITALRTALIEGKSPYLPQEELSGLLECVEASDKSHREKAAKFLTELLKKEKDDQVKACIVQWLKELEPKPTTWLDKILRRKQRAN